MFYILKTFKQYSLANSLEMVPALMSLLSFSSQNTPQSSFSPPLPLVDLLSGQNKPISMLVWNNACGE